MTVTNPLDMTSAVCQVTNTPWCDERISQPRCALPCQGLGVRSTDKDNNGGWHLPTLGSDTGSASFVHTPCRESDISAYGVLVGQT